LFDVPLDQPLQSDSWCSPEVSLNPLLFIIVMKVFYTLTILRKSCFSSLPWKLAENEVWCLA